MKVVAGVLLLLAAVGIVGGVLTLVNGSPLGLLSIVEGAVTGLLGLIMISASTDVRYIVETKFASIHLGNAFLNLAAFYKGQFFLALLLIVLVIVRLVVS